MFGDLEYFSYLCSRIYPKTHNLMENNRIISVSIDIADQMFCEFEAQFINSKNDGVFMQIDDEKKIVKNGFAIMLFGGEVPYITFKSGGLYFSLRCLKGNLEEFIGEYKVSLFGMEGRVDISNV